jgi:hypothetical protein
MNRNLVRLAGPCLGAVCGVATMVMVNGGALSWAELSSLAAPRFRTGSGVARLRGRRSGRTWRIGCAIPCHDLPAQGGQDTETSRWRRLPGVVRKHAFGIGRQVER